MSEPAVTVIPEVPAKVKAIKRVLDAQFDKIAQTCAKHLDPQRLFRVAMATIYRTPELQQCDPWSIANALLEAAQIGVEVGGPQDEAYLIPRKNKKSGSMECCFQVGYKGLIKIAIQSGAAKSVNAGVFYSNDKYEYSMGTACFVTHTPALGDRGHPLAAWCSGYLGTGEPFADVMPVAEIEKRRKLSQQPNGLMWKDFWDEGAMKTVTRHACKKLRGTPLLAQAIEAAEPPEYPAILTELPAARPMPKRLSETKQQPVDNLPATPAEFAGTGEPPGAAPESESEFEQRVLHREENLFTSDVWIDATTEYTDLCATLGWDEVKVIAHVNSAKLTDDPLAALRKGIEEQKAALAARRKK